MRQGSGDGFGPTVAASDAAVPNALKSSALDAHAGASVALADASISPESDDCDAKRERDNARRTAIVVICIVGSTLIFKMTALLEPMFNAPRPALYGLTGALFGAILGACQRAEELEDRVLHAATGAVILGIVFALFSLIGPLPRTGRYKW